MRRTLSTVAVFLAALASLVGCSSGDDDRTEPSQTATSSSKSSSTEPEPSEPTDTGQGGPDEQAAAQAALAAYNGA